MTRRPRRRDERVEGSAFMDVARQAYVRHLSLDRWRDVQDLMETNGLDWPAAVADAGRFPDRFPYQGLWRRRWDEHVVPAAATGDAAVVFAAIEAAVTAALDDEEAERAARGDRPLDLDPGFTAFLDQSFGRLARQGTDILERGDE